MSYRQPLALFIEDVGSSHGVDLRLIADQLDAWAAESRAGGWSTHQVDPMRKLADSLRRKASQL